MKTIILALFSLLVVSIAQVLAPDKAFEAFWNSLEKHLKAGDEGIFDKDFCIESKGKKYSRKVSIRIYMEEYKKVAAQPDEPDDGSYDISAYTDDGLLKVKKFQKNNKMLYYLLAKPNKNVEGGFMFYRHYLV